MSVFAVIDTNVLVSALLSSHMDAATVRVVDKLFTAEIIPLFNETTMAEYKEVLHRPKFHFPKEAIQNLLEAIRQNGANVEPVATGEIFPDQKDIVFYEVAMAKQDENAYLVTGNIKHFPVRPFVVTPKEMLDILAESSPLKK